VLQDWIPIYHVNTISVWLSLQNPIQFKHDCTNRVSEVFERSIQLMVILLFSRDHLCNGIVSESATSLIRNQWGRKAKLEAPLRKYRYQNADVQVQLDSSKKGILKTRPIPRRCSFRTLQTMRWSGKVARRQGQEIYSDLKSSCQSLWAKTNHRGAGSSRQISKKKH
jgi:hypothetical protein